jgi:AraC-like DNA-binding protein
MNNSIADRHKREGFLGQKMVVVPKNIRDEMEKNPIINTLHITDIGYYPRAEFHYRERITGAEEYILIYCVEGEGWIKFRDKKHKLVPNSYFIIPSDTSHTYGANKDDPWSIYWVHFTGKSARNLYAKYCFQNSSVKSMPEVIEIPFEKRRIDNFEGIISLLESGYSTEILEYTNIALWQVLASFVYYNFYSEAKHLSNKNDIVDKAIKYMKNNIGESISVDELADHLNYSNSYLYSLFKKNTGYSPIQYFNHLKIQKACQYLSFTKMSVKEISFALGFNDPFYFSRLFKKLIELSPTAYREKH